MKESRVEEVLVKAVTQLKGICWKWSSSRRGVPDRIILLPVPEEHQAIVQKYVKFVETKYFGRDPTPQQQYVHGLMREKGYDVQLVSTTDRAKAFLESLF